MLARLSADWTRVVASSGTQAAAAAINGVHTSEAPVAAESEVIAERLLRELTAEHIALLTTLQDTGGGFSACPGTLQGRHVVGGLHPEHFDFRVVQCECEMRRLRYSRHGWLIKELTQNCCWLIAVTGQLCFEHVKRFFKVRRYAISLE